MKSTKEIKNFLKEMGLTVRGNTGTGKSKWQSFHVPSDIIPISQLQVMKFSLPEFPVEFRKLCIRTVYPDSETLYSQDTAGNVGKYSIAMLPHQWEHVMAVWPLKFIA